VAHARKTHQAGTSECWATRWTARALVKCLRVATGRQPPPHCAPCTLADTDGVELTERECPRRQHTRDVIQSVKVCPWDAAVDFTAAQCHRQSAIRNLQVGARGGGGVVSRQQTAIIQFNPISPSVEPPAENGLSRGRKRESHTCPAKRRAGPPTARLGSVPQRAAGSTLRSAPENGRGSLAPRPHKHDNTACSSPPPKMRCDGCATAPLAWVVMPRAERRAGRVVLIASSAPD